MRWVVGRSRRAFAVSGRGAAGGCELFLSTSMPIRAAAAWVSAELSSLCLDGLVESMGAVMSETEIEMSMSGLVCARAAAIVGLIGGGGNAPSGPMGALGTIDCRPGTVSASSSSWSSSGDRPRAPASMMIAREIDGSFASAPCGLDTSSAGAEGRGGLRSKILLSSGLVCGGGSERLSGGGLGSVPPCSRTTARNSDSSDGSSGARSSL